MAGFLGFGNYEKPGPGVDKDQASKKSFFLFFELYFRKFWKLIQINMLFFVFCIPFCIPYVLAGLFTKNVVIATIFMIPIIGISVIIPGLTIILRNFAREEHAFLWGDFIDTIKKNWRQSLAVGVIDFAVYFVMITAISFYYGQLHANVWIVIPLAICIVFTTIFTFMQYYLMLMVITFDMKLKAIFKNAFIFAFAGLGRNFLITFFCGIVTLVAYILYPLSMFLVPFLLISLYGFIIVFNAWIIIKKFMIHENDGEITDTGHSVFEDQGKEH
jgi:Predicted integral membrane protein